MLLERRAVVELVVTLAGLVLVYAGVTALLRLVYKPPPEEPAPEPAGARARAPSRRRLLPAAVAAGLVAAVVAGFLAGGGTSTAAPPAGSCNGHVELCGSRTLPEIAIPATHNSMSVPLPGWYSSEQDRPIADQLADSIRGLLFDTHYADKLANGRLRTDFTSHGELARAGQDAVSPNAVAGPPSASASDSDCSSTSGRARAVPLPHLLRDRRDPARGGARRHPRLPRLASGRRDRRDQSGLPDAQGLRGRGQRRGPGAHGLHAAPASGRWATLRQMIDSNRRAVFLAENHAGAAPWYQSAYDRITQEERRTRSAPWPLLTDPAKLPASCKPNRGPGRTRRSSSSTTGSRRIRYPLSSHARAVNAYERSAGPRTGVREDLRDRKPNLLAVNFYLQGDVFRVVDTLNGVR